MPHEPWSGDLDLAAALEFFLLETNQVESAEEVLEFDRGGGYYVNGVYTYTGNGIPDVVEMLLLEELLTNHQYADPNGVWGAEVFEEFLRQWDFISPYLIGQDEEIILAAAAYLTLGGLDYLFWLRDALGMAIDYGTYGNTASQSLSVDRSVDGGPFTNLQQWWWLLEAHGCPSMSLELAQSFVEVVLDPDIPPIQWIPQALCQIGEGEGEGEEEGEGEGEGEGECGCWNDEFIPLWNITIGSNVDASVIDPGGCGDQPISGTTQVRAGRRIRVEYTGDPAWFNSWSASGTLLHGSADRKAEFVHVNPGQQVMASLVSSTVAAIPDSWIADVTVTPLDSRVTVTDTSVIGPSNALVRMTYNNIIQPENGPRRCADGWEFSADDNDYTLNRSVTCRVERVSAASPVITLCLSLNYAYYTHRASLSGPGQVFVGGEGNLGGFPKKVLAPVPNHHTIRRYVDDQNPPTALGYASFAFYPERGWQLEHAYDNYYAIFPTASSGRINCNTLKPMSVAGKLVRMPRLKWKMVSMDNAAAPQESLGYCTAEEAKAYYKAATPHNQSEFEGTGELVTLSATTFCGNEFVRWKGTGDVYTANGTLRTDVSLDAGDDEPERWVTNPTIYIKMAKKSSPWNPVSRTINAIARRTKPDTQVITWEKHWDVDPNTWPDENTQHRGDFFRHTFSLSSKPSLSFKGVVVQEKVVAVPEETTVDPPFSQEVWDELLGDSAGAVTIREGNYIIDEHALKIDERFDHLVPGDIITFRQGFYVQGRKDDFINPGLTIKIIYKFDIQHGKKHFFVRKECGGLSAQCPDFP